MSIFSFIEKTKSAVNSVTTALTADYYIFSVGSENIQVEGDNLTWGQVALASNQVQKTDKFELILVSTGEKVNFNDLAIKGTEVRAVKVADSKG